MTRGTHHNRKPFVARYAVVNTQGFMQVDSCVNHKIAQATAKHLSETTGQVHAVFQLETIYDLEHGKAVQREGV